MVCPCLAAPLVVGGTGFFTKNKKLIIFAAILLILLFGLKNDEKCNECSGG